MINDLECLNKNSIEDVEDAKDIIYNHIIVAKSFDCDICDFGFCECIPTCCDSQKLCFYDPFIFCDKCRNVIGLSMNEIFINKITSSNKSPTDKNKIDIITGLDKKNKNYYRKKYKMMSYHNDKLISEKDKSYYDCLLRLYLNYYFNDDEHNLRHPLYSLFKSKRFNIKTYININDDLISDKKKKHKEIIQYLDNKIKFV